MKSALAPFQSVPLKDAARQLLAQLGYQSDKFIAGAGSSPQAFLDLFGSSHAFDPAKALVPEWKTADLLFQLTDQELSRESSLFTDTTVKAGLLKSYVFIAIELTGSDYARGKFSTIARQLNRLFPMPVAGLITILNRYKFTIVENTPIDQEIALDPELLGKVFENLLASYNEETKTTARKQTGSFYTPRPIVDSMVDESLKAHLERALGGAHAPSRVVSGALAGNLPAPEKTTASPRSDPSSARAPKAARETRALPIKVRLDQLFTYTEEPHQFSDPEVATLIAAIDALKILDPACGSGAFPMGVLHKLVYILGKLDPDNDRWKQTQLAKLDSAPMREELERAFADNNDDYGRKLYLIENCLDGVDIQPIAIQNTRFQQQQPTAPRCFRHRLPRKRKI